MNKKKILVISTFMLILISFVLGFNLMKSNKKITCKLNKDNYNSMIYIDKKTISMDYKYNYDTIEECVDEFDKLSSYIEFITKKDGIVASINQNKYNMEYSIKVDKKLLSKDNYKLLEIEDIIKLKEKKDIISYYEKQGYTCN